MNLKIFLLLIFALNFFGACKEKQPKIPVIYISDLYHPFQDPDDHFDLAALYAIDEFDVKAIIFDMAQPIKNPGTIPIAQMNALTGKSITAYLGLKEKLKSPQDKAFEQKEHQEGCNKMIDILKSSKEKVIIIALGSLRDVAAAYNREPKLFDEKVSKLIVFIGEASKKDFIEYNVKLDPNAYIQVMNNMKNVYWVPCFDGGLWQNNGKASFWREHRSKLLSEASDPLINFFLYAFTKETDTTNFLSYINSPVIQNNLQQHITDNSIRLRDLWCCSVFPYFAEVKGNEYPFTFKPANVFVDSNAVLHYTETGNTVQQFNVTDSLNYRERMTKIFVELSKHLKD